METFIGIFLILALCVWILIDARQLRKKSFEAPRTDPHLPSTVAEVNQSRYFVLGLACVFFAFAVAEWLNPSLPPFNGRGAWLYQILYYGIGPKAPSVFWALFGIVIGLVAFFKKTGSGE